MSCSSLMFSDSRLECLILREELIPMSSVQVSDSVQSSKLSRMLNSSTSILSQ